MALAIFPRDTFQDAFGTILADAEVTIRRESDNGLAQLFSNRAGTVPAANPTTTDAEGRIEVYLAGGTYRAIAHKAGFTVIRRHVAVGTMAERDYTDTPTYKSVDFEASTALTPVAGQIFLPTDNAQLGTNHAAWVGQVPYVCVPMGTEGQDPQPLTYKPLGTWGLETASFRTGAFTLTPYDAGRLVVMNNTSAGSVTVPAGILPASRTAVGDGAHPSMIFSVLCIGEGAVTLISGSGVTFADTVGASPVTLTKNRVLRFRYVRTGLGTAAVYPEGAMGGGAGVGGDAADIAYDNTASGLAAINVQDAIDERLMIYRDAAWFTANNPTPNPGQEGYVSDTGLRKVGNGSDDWLNLPAPPGGGAGHDPVTLAEPVPVLITENTTLDGAYTAVALAGQELALDRSVRVEPDEDPIDLTLGADLRVTDSLIIEVENENAPVRIRRSFVTLTREGDTTDTSDVIANINAEFLEAGFGVSGPGIPSGATIVDPQFGDGEIQISVPATATASNVELQFDCGRQGILNGREDDITCHRGTVVVVVKDRTFGIDARVYGDIDDGYGRMSIVPITGDARADTGHFGRALHLIGDDGTQTYTVAPAAELGAALTPGTRIELFADEESGATAFDIAAGSGVTFSMPDTHTASIVPGGSAVLTYIAADRWKLTGQLVPVA